MINVEVNDPRNKEKTFPKIMFSNQQYVYVLFEEPSKGTVIHDARTPFQRHQIGKHKTDWKMSEFTDFHGTITLSNGENQ